MEEDWQAALEWQEYQQSLCPNCGLPRVETFDKATDDHWNVEVVHCHACAARESKAWARNSNRDRDSAPEFGAFYAVTGLDDEYERR